MVTTGASRRLDGVCVTSRPSQMPKWSEPVGKDRIRDQYRSGWLDGEQVVLVECKWSGESWGAYGQLSVYQKLFELDWDANVEHCLVVVEESVPGNRGDTEWLFKNELEGTDLVIHPEGRFSE